MELSDNYKVYIHKFPNGKVYIGITKQEPSKRWGGQGQGYKKCPRMNKAIAKYGWNNIEHCVLYENLSKSSAEQIEIALISQYESNNPLFGYNIENGGNAYGTHSIETRNKISIGNKGKAMPPCSESLKRYYSEIFAGESNPFYGRKHTQESKDKISASRVGNKWARREPVLQYSLSGELISEHESIQKAHANTGVSIAGICMACSGKYKKSGGYIWKYKEKKRCQLEITENTELLHHLM